jgi:hypothetical protein
MQKEQKMANGTITFTPQQIDALANEIKKQVAATGGAAPAGFCNNWDAAKGVLQLLQPILGAIPGIGLFAGPAIGIVIAAGDAAKKALCH